MEELISSKPVLLDYCIEGYELIILEYVMEMSDSHLLPWWEVDGCCAVGSQGCAKLGCIYIVLVMI